MGDNIELKDNPRSSGVVADGYYEKTTSLFSLLDEANEIKRCHTMGIITEHIKVVDLISYDEIENTLRTAMVKGVDLFLFLWNSTSILRILKGYDAKRLQITKSRIIESAIWLRNYHNSSRMISNPTEELNWLIRMFDSKLDYIRVNKLLKDDLVNSIRKSFLAPVENLKDDFIQDDFGHYFCRTHGDFVVYNIIFDEIDNFFILDFGDTKINSNFEDVVRFYSILLAISETNIIRKKFLKGVCDRFLEEYGLNKNVLKHPLFKCFMAYNYLVQLVGHHSTRKRQSFLTYYETKSISDFGVIWLKNNV